MNKLVHEMVDEVINGKSDFLDAASSYLHNHPELKFKETLAHNYLCDNLEAIGFDVTRQYVLKTAFRAVFDTKRPGPTVAVLLEYDALPEIGHACGHNLIAEAGLGAALAIKEVLISSDTIGGKVVALGTPAEEGGGGKVELINAAVFKDIDVALMVHPSKDNHIFPPFIGIQRVYVEYYGKEAHASGFPWEGINALDAAVSFYNSLAYLRQHIKPTCRIHAIIEKGGDAPNIIPGYSKLSVYFRASTTKDMIDLQNRIEKCISSAANATGCKSSFHYEPHPYQGLITNKVLAERYRMYAEKLGVKFCDGDANVIPFMASTDMGNVSHVVPSIHPTYSINTKAPNHSREFTAAAITPFAHDATLKTAKCMAMLGLDVMMDPQFLAKVKHQFNTDLLEDAGTMVD